MEPYEVVFRNRGAYCSFDAPRVAAALRELVGGSLVVRIGSWFIQVQAPRSVAERVAWAGRSMLGEPLWGPSKPPEASGPEGALALARVLVERELFWEAHEALEHVWSGGVPSLWPAVVATGALAKAQEGLPGAAWRLVWETLSVASRVPGGSRLVDVGGLAAAVSAVLSCSGYEFGRVLGSAGWLLGESGKSV